MTNIELIFNNDLKNRYSITQNEINDQVKKNITITENKLKQAGYLIGAKDFAQKYWSDFETAFKTYSKNILKEGALPFDESILKKLENMAKHNHVVAYCNDIVKKYGFDPLKETTNPFLTEDNIFGNVTVTTKDTISALVKGIATNQLEYEKTKKIIEYQRNETKNYDTLKLAYDQQAKKVKDLEEKNNIVEKNIEQYINEYNEIVDKIMHYKEEFHTKQKNKKYMTKEQLLSFKQQKKAWKVTIQPNLMHSMGNLQRKLQMNSMEAEGLSMDLEIANKNLKPLKRDYDDIATKKEILTNNQKLAKSLKTRIDIDTSILKQLNKNISKDDMIL